MIELSFDRVSHAELASVSGVLDSGCHVLLGSERDGTNSVVLLASGMVRPAAGRLTLGGRAPYASASTRRTIGALCADEQLPTARNAAGAVDLALCARGDARSAASVLDAAGLGYLAARRLRGLTAREARAVALAIALSHPEPRLLALHEPLALLDFMPERFLFDTLQRRAAQGAVVLVTTSRVEDAGRLGGEAHAIERGVWLDSATHRTLLRQATLRVETANAERLAARLTGAEDISSVLRVGLSELLVRGADAARVSASIIRGARAEAIQISALRQDFSTLEVLTAARAGIAQTSVEASPP
ncbi:MAG TPA: hypothetical protein VGL19_06275 [Polyangiaceae bacterium]|jgi:ABC-type multidrug transport system ATPase subunit